MNINFVSIFFPFPIASRRISGYFYVACSFRRVQTLSGRKEQLPELRNRECPGRNAGRAPGIRAEVCVGSYASHTRVTTTHFFFSAHTVI